MAYRMMAEPRFRVALAVHDPAQHEVDPTIRALQAALERHRFWPILAAETVDAVIQPRADLIMLQADSVSSAGIGLCRTLKNTPSLLSLIPPIILLVPNNGRRREDFYERLIDESGADDAFPIPLRDVDMRHMATIIQLKRQISQLEGELAERNQQINQANLGKRELSILKDSIVNNVSHELRTPLLQVKSAVAMLDAEVKAKPELHDMSRLMGFATQATSRLESVIQNISLLAASLSLKVEPMRLADSVKIAIRQLGRQWAVSGDMNRVKVFVDDVPLVLGDRSGIAQVLQQLIDNALKFSPGGGAVEIRAVHTPDDNMVRIAVSDPGIGLESDQIERIFQEFYQVDQGSTRRFGGTGIGLAIVKLILDNLGIEITVESKPGIGSTFSFALPVA